MGKRGKKKSKQTLSDSRRSPVNHRRKTFWFLGGLLVVAAIVVAWTTLRDESPKTSASTSVEQPRTEVPDTNLDIVKTDSVKSDTAAGAPQISFPEAVHDFGTITQGSKVSHKFVVRNTGDAPLRLIRAQGS